jgi:ribosomal protein L7Ae-like RNA K-turn-binding protein
MKKIISYLGFAQKSNNCVMGQTALKKSMKKFYLFMVCESASDNLKDLAKNLANKHNCECIILKTNLSELLNFNDIKIIGLTDESLSSAIIKHFPNATELN